jgi:hypothetical protein
LVGIFELEHKTPERQQKKYSRTTLSYEDNFQKIITLPESTRTAVYKKKKNSCMGM